MPKTKQIQPPLRAVPMPLFNTLDNLQEVLELSESCLPVTTKNELHILLMTYHNTLLKVLHEQQHKTTTR